MEEDFVQPHQRAIEVHLNPVRCACDTLTMIPTLYKAHTNGTHLDVVKDNSSLIHELVHKSDAN